MELLVWVLQQLRKVAVGQELVREDLCADEPRHCVAVLVRGAQQPSEWPQGRAADHVETEVRHVHEAPQVAEQHVDDLEQREEGDEHGPNVQHEINGEVCTVARGLDDVVLRGRGELEVLVIVALGPLLALLALHAAGRAHEVRDQQRARHRHHRGPDQLLGLHAHADVRGEHPTGDAGEAADHDAMNVTRACLWQEGLDEQGCLRLAKEEIRRGIHRLDQAGAHGLLQEQRYDAHGDLHHAHVVHGRDEGREEDDRRQHFEREEVLLEAVAEYEARAEVGEVQEVTHGVPGFPEDGHANFGAHHEHPHEELEQSGRQDHVPRDVPDLLRQGRASSNEHHGPDEGLLPGAALGAVRHHLHAHHDQHDERQDGKDAPADLRRHRRQSLADLRELAGPAQDCAHEAHGGHGRQGPCVLRVHHHGRKKVHDPRCNHGNAWQSAAEEAVAPENLAGDHGADSFTAMVVRANDRPRSTRQRGAGLVMLRGAIVRGAIVVLALPLQPIPQQMIGVPAGHLPATGTSARSN
mmetsp:Transcript_17919/g.49461  ORF Transcript_17919/g.49461 Transcript_17919/m.49461 type:complete len:524 (+) Transcript_17919:458-2029(+)